MAAAATSGAADIEQYFGQIRKINVDYRWVVDGKCLLSDVWWVSRIAWVS